MSAICRKCGEPLAFRKLSSGKWSPMNPDGSDHWDLCRSITRAGKPETAPGIPTRGVGVTHVWAGALPPWDESLGEFRDFTAEEKAAGIVCRAV